MQKKIILISAAMLGLQACGGSGGSSTPPPPPPPPPVVDTTPQIYTFTDVMDAELSTEVTSNEVIINDINAAASISITGGTYSVNNGAFVSASGTVNSGDSVRVRLTSSAASETIVDAVLNVGGVTDTFSVTTQAPASLAANPANYFTNKVNDSSPSIFNCTGNAATCTADLQGRLDVASGEDADGGVVIIRQGTYELNRLNFPSNVRLEVETGTIIIQKQNRLFDMGLGDGSAPQLENIEITSTDGMGRFTIDASGFTKAGDIRPVRVGHVTNFSLSNFNLETNFYSFPTIFLVADDNDEAGQAADGSFNATFDRHPVNGFIENIDATNIATGYALVQPFSATNILMRNLEAERGVTIRLEPANGRLPGDRLNAAGPRFGAINGVRMEDIRNVGGFSAVFIKPHTKICEDNSLFNASGTNSSFVLFADTGSAERSVGGATPTFPDFTRAYFTSFIVEGTIKHTVTDPDFMADTTFSGHYYMPRTHREAGFTTFGSLPVDAAGQRKLAPPSIPVAVAAALSKDDLGNDAPDGASFIINPPKLSSEPDLALAELRKFAGRYYVDLSTTSFEVSGIDFSKLGKIGSEVTAAYPVMYRSHAISGNGSATPNGYINP